jgi:hypothetical protein
MLRTRLALALFGVLIASTMASAQTVNLAWDASTDTTITGYVVKWGTRAGNYTSSMDVGNRTSWTIGSLVPDQKYYFVVTSYAATGVSSAPSNEVSNDALIVQTGAALADQRPSLFWYNPTSGQLMSWHIKGTNVIDTRPVNLVNTDSHWKVAGTGDLNADGFTDILWRHDTQGWLAYWLMQYDTVVGTGYLSIKQNTDFNWQIKGLGDVNGDGYADIVWQHVDGSLAVWTMRGPTVLGTTLFSIPKVGDPKWQIAAIADMNGDGKGDLIWQDPTAGWLAVWFLNGTTVVGTYYFSINRQPDVNWRIQAAGDVDASGVPKLFWRHLTEGWVGEWTISGINVTGTFFTNPNKVDNLNWSIVGGR